MSGTFDFCDTSRTAVEIPPDDGMPINFNGWEFSARPSVPYRRKFTVTLTGMRWYLGSGTLDLTTNPKRNAGRLLKFYRENGMWDVFSYNHEYLGNILCKFAAPVNVPKAEPDSDGKIGAFDITLIHHNPAYE